MTNGKLRKKARRTILGAYPAVRKFSYLGRWSSLRRQRTESLISRPHRGGEA